MKKIAVFLFSVLLIYSFCSCTPEEMIPSYNESIVNSSEESMLNSTTQSSTPSNGRPSENLPSADSSHYMEGNSSVVDTSSQNTSSEADVPDNTEYADRYNYAQLTKEQKGIYKALEQAVKNMEMGWINLQTPVYDGYRKDINVVVTALQNDAPQYFWIPSSYYTGSSQNGETIRILFEGQDNLTYLIDASNRIEFEDKLQRRISEIKAQVTANNPFEIELQLHDILCKSITYSPTSNDPLVYTAYGALINGEAVCEGYSRAMQLLLAEYGIKSTLVTGIADNIGHMWNLVKIENNWYHLDATWNDLPNGKVAHTYFNLTDEEILTDHTKHKLYSELTYEEIVCETPTPYNFMLPNCNANSNNYFEKVGYIYSPTGEADVANRLKNFSDMIEFKFSDNNFKNQFLENKDDYLNIINEILDNEDSDFRISKYTVTNLTLIIYK